MLNYTIVAPRPSLRLGLFLCFFFFFLLLTDLRTGLALSVVQRSYSCVMEHDDALSTDLERDPLDDDYSGYLWLPCSCSIVFSLSPVSSFFLLSYAMLRSKAQALVAANASSTSGCGDLGMMLGASSRGATTGLTVIRESANQGDPDAAHHPFLSNREATLKTMELVVEISLEYSTTQQTRRPESYPRAGLI